MARFATDIVDYIDVVGPMLTDVIVSYIDHQIVRALNNILFVDIRFELFNFCQCVVDEFDLNWY